MSKWERNKEGGADEIEEIYKYKRELLEKLSPSKNDAEGSRVWEALPASERQRVAKEYYDYCLRELEKVDERLKQLQGESHE
jgi:hypothetical protein